MNWTGFVGGTITAIAGVYAESELLFIHQIRPSDHHKIKPFSLLTRFPFREGDEKEKTTHHEAGRSPSFRPTAISPIPFTRHRTSVAAEGFGSDAGPSVATVAA